MELTATKRPFIYVPLRNHFEQNLHVPHRLARYGAGTRMDYDRLEPEALAHGRSPALTAGHGTARRRPASQQLRDGRGSALRSSRLHVPVAHRV